MKIWEISIERPVFTWMIMAALIFFGLLSYRGMGVSNLPDVDMPYVNISVRLDGASPEVMEAQVVDPIERSILSIQGVKGMFASARAGLAQVSLEFEISKNIDFAIQEVRARVGRIQRKLPEDAETPIVTKSNPEDRPIMWVSVMSDQLNTRELMTLVRDRVRDQFTTIEGVADVYLSGFLEPSLRIWLSPEKLRQYALSVDDIYYTIQSEHKESPAGKIVSKEKEYGLRVFGEAMSVEQFRNLYISRRGGAPNFRPIKLGDVAEVELGLEDQRRLSRSNGKPSIGLGIVKQRGSNAVSVGERVKKKMAVVQAIMPKGVEIRSIYNSTKYIKEAVNELIFTLFFSGLLTAIVCWLFLGSLSATFNVVLAIPTSIIGSFIMLKMFNFTLNTFTLLGLSLAIGIVVDDAIMVLENIVRHREKGETRKKSALLGTGEIAFAAIAATIAIIAIFLPVAFMEGVIGKYFLEFGVTISVAVALSLLEALTLTPMRCSKFLDAGKRKTRIGHWLDHSFERLSNRYRKLLNLILKHPWKVFLSSMLIFTASLSFMFDLRKEFVPAQDQGSLFIRVKAPIGYSLYKTDTEVKGVEKLILDRPEVKSLFTAVGGWRGDRPNTAYFFLTMKDYKNRGYSPETKRRSTQQEFAKLLRKKFENFKNLEIVVQDLSTRGFGGRRGFPISFKVQGPEWDHLIRVSKKIQKKMKNISGLADVHTDFVGGVPEYRVIPDRIQSGRYGVSVSDIGDTIQSMIGGVVPAYYTQGGKRSEIRIGVRDFDRTQAKDLKRLDVRNNRGELVALSSVVKVTEGTGPQTINRIDRERSISISASVNEGYSQSDLMVEVKKVTAEVLPEGYHTSFGGSSQSFLESFRGLIFALILGLAVSYMVLASQFNSFIHPITVLIALPFSVSGAFISLWLGGQSINVYSMIGIILLTGIVKKNSILLVDFTNQSRKAGMETIEALKTACPLRLRPIMMTSFATIAAAIPPALNIGPGSETRIPMALTVIGGVIVSTIFTLIVVPCVYRIFDRS